MHKENSKWIPNYVIKGPKDCSSVRVSPESLKFRVLMIHKDKNELKGTNVSKYISWGEKQKYQARPTCSSRKRWYDLGEWQRPPMVWIKGIWTRHFIPYTAKTAYVDQQLYEVVPKREMDDTLLAVLLNSSITALFAELGGRVNFGEGILWIAAYEAQSILVINPLAVDNSTKKKILKMFDKVGSSPVSSIFDEIGSTMPEKISLSKIKPDRRKLDEIIMEEILGLSEDEQKEVYTGIIYLVKTRLEKAQSV